MESKSKRTRARALRLVTAAVAVAIILTVAAALLPTVAAEAATTDATFESRLASAEAVVKFAESEAAPIPTATRTRTETPIVVPKKTVARTSSGTSAGSGSTGSSSAGDPQAILARYIARYPILAGTTVSYGDAKGHQAIAYYTSGRIVISTSHTASLDRIIGHEIWHIIDWRDNGVIDWGENVPPR